jgi:hypothetical protein
MDVARNGHPFFDITSCLKIELEMYKPSQDVFVVFILKRY